MKVFSRQPLIRLAILLVSGILCSDIFENNPLQIQHLLILLFFSVVLTYLSGRTSSSLVGISGGLMICALLFALGLFLGLYHYRGFNSADNESAEIKENTYLVKCLESKSGEVGSWTQQIMEVVAVQNDTAFYLKKFRIAAILEKDSIEIGPGDLILIVGILQSPEPPSNRALFDYASYLRRKGVHYQIYAAKDEYKKVCEACELDMRTRALILRGKIEQSLIQSGLGKDSYAFLSALILGDRSYIGNESMEKFRNAGVVHVMAVSGLHVGTLYFVLQFLAGFLKRLPVLRYLQLPILLGLLWLYAFITGLSPSVTRASAVLSLIAVGRLFNEQVHTFNLLAASAILLLVVNPNNIYDLGFQLSYTAVTGILLLHPLIYSCLSFKFSILDKIWSLTSVSLAAQIVTAPFILYNFHQFPTYFLLGNIVVLPLVTIIFYLGLCFIVFHRLPIIADLLSGILDFLIHLTELFLNWVSTLPYTTLNDIYLSLPQSLLVMLVIAFLLLRIKTGNIVFSFIGLFCILELIRSVYYFNKDNSNHIDLYIVEYRGRLIVDVINRDINAILIPAELHEDSLSLSKNLYGLLVKKSAERSVFYNTAHNFELNSPEYWIKSKPDYLFIQFGDYRLLQVKNPWGQLKHGFHRLDYLLLPTGSMNSLQNRCIADSVIFYRRGFQSARETNDQITSDSIDCEIRPLKTRNIHLKIPYSTM